MKKIIMLCLLILTMSVAYSQKVVTDSTTTDPTTVSQVERLIDKYGGKLVAFAQSLKVPAEHVYQILVKQQQVKALINLIVIISALLLSVIMLVWIYKACHNRGDDVFHNEGSAFLFIIFLIVLVIVIIMFLTGLSSMLTGIINPEYGAIKDIGEMIL